MRKEVSDIILIASDGKLTSRRVTSCEKNSRTWVNARRDSHYTSATPGTRMTSMAITKVDNHFEIALFI